MPLLLLLLLLVVLLNVTHISLGAKKTKSNNELEVRLKLKKVVYEQEISRIPSSKGDLEPYTHLNVLTISDTWLITE